MLALLERHPKVAWAHRMNVGAVKRGARFIRFGEPGMCDITGQLRSGLRLEIEMKRPGKQLTEAQRAFIDRVCAAGGVAFVAHDVEEVRCALRLLP